MDSKILMTGWGYPPKIDGGLDIHVKHLFEQLLSSEIQVDLALPKDRAPEKRNTYRGRGWRHGPTVSKAEPASSKVS